MKNKISILAIIIFALLNFINCKENNMEKLETILDTIKNSYAPDKRTAIFNVKSEFKDGKVFISGETDNNEAKNELIYPDLRVL